MNFIVWIINTQFTSWQVKGSIVSLHYLINIVMKLKTRRM